jgi:hypothetical protein
MNAMRFYSLRFRQAATGALLLLLGTGSIVLLTERPALAQPAPGGESDKTASGYALEKRDLAWSTVSPSAVLLYQKKLSLPALTLGSGGSEALWAPQLPAGVQGMVAGIDIGIGATLRSPAMIRLSIPPAAPSYRGTSPFFPVAMVGLVTAGVGIVIASIATVPYNNWTEDGRVLWKQVTRNGRDRGACNLTANKEKCRELYRAIDNVQFYNDFFYGWVTVAGAGSLTFITASIMLVAKSM